MPDDYASRIGQYAAPAERAYGYPLRQALPSEHNFFYANKNVGGMAADDGSIVLNPYSSLSKPELSAVVRNEAARLYMREKGVKPDFALTPQQMKTFEGTVYGKPENADYAKQSIIGRALSGDPSAGDLTPEQQTWADRIEQQLKARAP